MPDNYSWKSHVNAPSAGVVLCPLSLLSEDEPKFFSLSVQSSQPFVYFVVKRGSKVHAYLNRCPHKQLPLGTKQAKPEYADGKITCIQHRAKFEVDTGQCVSGVCKGLSLNEIACLIRGKEVVVG